jgi:hypothetical protein
MEYQDDLQNEPRSGKSAGMREPGLDRHEWETAWESLEDSLHEAPIDALPDVGDLVEEMLVSRGFSLGSDGEPTDSELVLAYRAAHEVTVRVERGDDVDPGDVADAINAYREIYEQLIDRPDN